MDALAATAISVVAPYITKGAEALATEVGKQVAGGVEALYTRLKTWWLGEPVAEVAVGQIAKDPVKYGKLLETMLAGDLAKDPAFAAEVQGLVDVIGPQIHVVQRIVIANGVTGAEIGTFSSGKVDVEQHISEATNVTGFKATQVG